MQANYRPSDPLIPLTPCKVANDLCTFPPLTHFMIMFQLHIFFASKNKMIIDIIVACFFNIKSPQKS